MIDLAVLAGVAVAIGSIFLVFGCLCHLFKKSQPGFSAFENDVETGQGQGFSIYTTQNAVVNTNDTSQVTFEPLPDILAKTVTATALRPRITCIDREKQRISTKHLTVYRPFPRSQLIYIKEVGLGWFGQVLLSDAERISVNSKKSRCVVKLLKDDASPTEQQLFLEEMAAYREIEHPSILRLMGQCTESSPLLVILEHSPYGDLKTYLLQNQADADSMVRRGVLVNFMIDMSAGLACLHRHGYLHHDFSCRNCMVMSDFKVKVGDYGVAEDHFREDYYDTGQDLLPVRWMAPDILQLNNSIWQVLSFTSEANIWALGIAMWEVLQFGKRPYDSMSDEEVLHHVVRQRTLKLTFSETTNPLQQRLNEIMGYCWQEDTQRPTAEGIHTLLHQVLENFRTKEQNEQSEFDAKWDQACAKDSRTYLVGSQIQERDLNTLTSKESMVINIPENDNINDTVESKYVHIEPKIIVSKITPKKTVPSDEKAKVHQAGLYSPILPQGPESVKEPPMLAASQRNGVVDSNLVGNLTKNSPTYQVSTNQETTFHEKGTLQTPHANEENTSPLIQTKTDAVCVQTATVNTPSSESIQGHSTSKTTTLSHITNGNGHISEEDSFRSEGNESVVILGGSGQNEEDFNLSLKENVSPFPSKTGTPQKGSALSFQLTSTPVPKVTPAVQDTNSVYLSTSSNQATQNADESNFFTAENTPVGVLKIQNKDSDMRTDNKGECLSEKVEYDQSPKSHPPVKSLSPQFLCEDGTRKGDEFLRGSLRENDILNDDEKESDVKEIKYESSDSEDDYPGHRKEDDGDSTEKEKLQLLKLTLANALNTDNDGQNFESEGQNKCVESPSADDLDIAREIYMSRGVTIPPTTHTTPRSLNTIPEDDIPVDNIPPMGRIPSEGDSVLSTPTKLALKFEDPSEEFSGTASELFEWDDYISDELQLVGDVKYSESSPRQTMDFPEWSLDNDSSSQESDSKILATVDANSSASSVTESRSGSRGSSLSTPYSTSESEDSDSENESSGVKTLTVPKCSKKKKSCKNETNKGDQMDKQPAVREEVGVTEMEELKVSPMKPPRLKLIKPSFDEEADD